MTDKTIIEVPATQKDMDPTIRESIVAPTIHEDNEVADMESNNSDFRGLARGEKIGKCQLDEPIKVNSGEAELWIGTRLRDNRKIVVKIYRWNICPKDVVQEKMASVAVKHIVELLDHGQLEDKRHYEILEYIEHGTLTDWSHNGLSENQRKDILRELSEAIHAVHAEGIIHRDIKPDNVLVRSKDPLNLVLTDFGISSVVALSLHFTNNSRTAAYAPPESLSRDAVIGTFSDWWSLGVIMLELLDKNPFVGIDERVINHELSVRGISVPNTVSEEWQQLLRGLLTRDTYKRWGAEQVSSWLKGKRDNPVFYAESIEIADTEAKQPYTLAGKKYRTAAELGKAVAENWEEWEEAVKHLARGWLAKWVLEDLRDQDMASQLTDLVDDNNLNGEMKVFLAGMILNRDVPITWQGEIISREWMTQHHDSATSILKSSIPEWDKRLRDTSWLIELRAWRNKVHTHIEKSGASCNQKLVDQLVVSLAETVESEAKMVRENYVASSNTVLNALFGQRSLSAEDNILLVACDPNLLVPKSQWQEWEQETRAIKEWAHKIEISLEDDPLTKAVRMQGEALRKAVASLRAQFAGSTVEELSNILANNTLTDREARLLIACEQSLLLTKEQCQKQEWERETLEIKKQAQKFGISIDDNLLAQAVRLQGDALRKEVNSLRNRYGTASVEELKNIMENDNRADRDARLLIACDKSLLLTKKQVKDLKKIVDHRGMIGMIIGAGVCAIIGAKIGWGNSTGIWALIFWIVGALFGIIFGGFCGFLLGKRLTLNSASLGTMGLFGVLGGIIGYWISDSGEVGTKVFSWIIIGLVIGYIVYKSKLTNKRLRRK